MKVCGSPENGVAIRMFGSAPLSKGGFLRGTVLQGFLQPETTVKRGARPYLVF